MEKSSSFFSYACSDTVHDQRKLVNEFVRNCSLSILHISAELVDHSSSNTLSNPYIAINYPDQISLCLPISPAHVPYFRVGPQVVLLSIAAQVWIILFDEDFGIKVGEVCQETFENGICWVYGGSYAEIYGELLKRICLVKCRSEAFVELGFEAFDRSEDGNVWNMV